MIDPDDGRCFIMTCAESATERLFHPDRGLVEACEHHARNVRELRTTEKVPPGVTLK